MDAVLQRMLVVEQQAEAVVREAEQEAETILAAARRDAAELEVRLQRDAAAEADRTANAQLSAAAEIRRKTLAQADVRLAEVELRLRQGTDAATGMVVERLAYPSAGDVARTAVGP